MTQTRALTEGAPLAEVIAAFTAALARADRLVAHNIAFDEKITGTEYHRLTGRDPLRTTIAGVHHEKTTR